jgi:hypothetical protein
MIRARTSAALFIGLIAALQIATPAEATSTHAEYVAQVTPICDAANAEIDHISAERDRKLDLSEKALLRIGPARYFKRLTKTYEWESDRSHEITAAALARLDQVPPAPGDEALVAQWLGNRHLQQDLDTRIDHLLEKSSGPKKHLSPRAKRNRKREGRELDQSLDQSLIALFLDVELAKKLGVLSCVRGAELLPPTDG